MIEPSEKNPEFRVPLSMHPNDNVQDSSKPSSLYVQFDFDSSIKPDTWIWLMSDSNQADEAWFKLTHSEAIDLAYALIKTVKDNTNEIS